MNITGILFIVVPLAGIVTLLFLPEIKAGLIRWWRRADAPVAAPESAPQQLRIYTRDGVVGVLPLRVAGFTLVVEDSKGGQKVINVGTAVDADAFWAAWKRLGGQADGWVDEDGRDVIFKI